MKEEKFEIDKKTVYFISGYIFGMSWAANPTTKKGLERVERTLTKACGIESIFDEEVVKEEDER